MTEGQRILLGFATVFSVATFVIVFEVLAVGRPPIHCRYMVPVKAHLGIYSCSQYPRPVTAP